MMHHPREIHKPYTGPYRQDKQTVLLVCQSVVNVIFLVTPDEIREPVLVFVCQLKVQPMCTVVGASLNHLHQSKATLVIGKL